MTRKAFYSIIILVAVFATMFVTGAYAQVSVSPTTMNLKVGQKATLTVSTRVGDMYRVKSLDPSVASVSDATGHYTQSFTVTAVARGTTKIRVSQFHYVAECTVTVRDNTPDVWPTSATLEYPALTLKVGQRLPIRATVLPANYNQGTPRWSFDKPGIASADPNGLSATLEGLTPGVTTLTFTIGNATASCVLTIVPKTQPEPDVWPTSATLEYPALTLKVGQRLPIRATVLPANYNQGTPRWSFNKPGIASADPNGLSATLEGLTPGVTTLTFTIGNATASCVLTIVPNAQPQPNPQTIKAIVIEPASIELYAGDRCQFRAKAQPEGAALPAGLTWKITQGTSVAKILRTEAADCWIDALRPGRATITLTAGNLKAEAPIYVK